MARPITQIGHADIYLKTSVYDFDINAKYIMAFEKCETVNGRVYYKAYTIDNKSYDISEEVYEEYMSCPCVEIIGNQNGEE